MSISSPLLEASIEGQGDHPQRSRRSNLGLQEVYEAAEMIQEVADKDANIIFGTVLDESLKEEIVITVIATGFDQRRRHLPKTR